MGKTKEQKVELMNAFSRMNFLFQAGILASKAAPDSILSNYYGRLMKEVSKKVVEKIHPDIKRALCSSCSYPLFANDYHASVKVRPHKKKKRKKKIRENIKKEYPKREYTGDNNKMEDCGELKKTKKILKPNKLLWSCNKCGFTRSFLQRPLHCLWIDMCGYGEKEVSEEQCQVETSDHNEL